MRQDFKDHGDVTFGRRNLPLLRAELRRQLLDGFIVPHDDEHQSEVLPSANERLAWITGFTGSAGLALVLEDNAALFVDGRYTLQVREQVDPDLFEYGALGEAGLSRFLNALGGSGKVIGFDPRLHSCTALEQLRPIFVKAGLTLRPTEANPLDLAWAPTRPQLQTAPVVAHMLKYSGEESNSKRRRIGAEVDLSGADAALIVAPAAIAWLFNIRGADVNRSPLPIGQAILKADGSAELFLDAAQISPSLKAWLGDQVKLRPAQDLLGALTRMRERRVLLDPTQSSVWHANLLKLLGVVVISARDPIILQRACKNSVEIEGARQAHLRDGVALTRMLHWIATEGSCISPDEIELASRLEAFRDDTGLLRDLSFDTTAGAGPNSAIVHYRPTFRTNRRVCPGQLLLIDSGGQYLDGTTDVTRTVVVGSPTPEMRDRYTRVLKGHAAIARARFPEGTPGAALDVLARQFLWFAGIDYDHGTGHGVGSYLTVHEGPQSFSRAAWDVPLQPGMIISNEPGYYKPGEFGMRIENLLTVTAAYCVAGGEKAMQGFETLTLAPYDRHLIDVEMLDGGERAQINAYHAQVLSVLTPHLPIEVHAWLEGVCSPL